MQMRKRLVVPGKADIRCLRIHFPNLDSRTFSREVGECPSSTHADTCYRPQAPVEGPQWLCSSASAGMAFTFTMGNWDEIITDSNTVLAWTWKTDFIPLPSVIVFHCCYLNFCIPFALAQIVPSTERDVDEKGTLERLKQHCVTGTA